MKKQPLKNSKPASKPAKKPKVSKPTTHPQRPHRQKYGTSKLEVDFAREFLDKLGVKYIYEYEAKDIRRFYDFAITVYDNIDFITENKHGVKCIKQDNQIVPIAFMIEVDGGFFHSDPRVVDEKKLNPMQKHNKFVDSVKDKWCELHGFPLLRIWEYDIRKNPKKVFGLLEKYLGEGFRKRRIDENRKKPH